MLRVKDRGAFKSQATGGGVPTVMSRNAEWEIDINLWFRRWENDAWNGGKGEKRRGRPNDQSAAFRTWMENSRMEIEKYHVYCVCDSGAGCYRSVLTCWLVEEDCILMPLLG